MVSSAYNQEQKTITLVFSGRMDTLAVAGLNDAIEEDPVMKDREPDSKIVFDLQDVDYIASSFIRICISYARQAGTGRFSVVNCQPFIKKTFKISGLDEILNIR
jgi:anti-anti-sigma factor